MRATKRWRLVCYDVRDPARYRRVYKLVRGAGRPVQYSIFRCRLDDRECERLRWQLAKVMSPDDRLLIVDLCPGCAERVVSRNHVEEWVVTDPTFMIVPAVPEQASMFAAVVGRPTTPKLSPRRRKRTDS